MFGLFGLFEEGYLGVDCLVVSVACVCMVVDRSRHPPTHPHAPDGGEGLDGEETAEVEGDGEHVPHVRHLFCIVLAGINIYLFVDVRAH